MCFNRIRRAGFCPTLIPKAKLSWPKGLRRRCFMFFDNFEYTGSTPVPGPYAAANAQATDCPSIGGAVRQANKLSVCVFCMIQRNWLPFFVFFFSATSPKLVSFRAFWFCTATPRLANFRPAPSITHGIMSIGLRQNNQCGHWKRYGKNATARQSS